MVTSAREDQAERDASDPPALRKQKPWGFSVPSHSRRSPCHRQPTHRAALPVPGLNPARHRRGRSVTGMRGSF